MKLLRETVRRMILESIHKNKLAFQKDLLGHSDWDEGEDDTINVEDGTVDQGDVPQRSRTRGRPLKQIWAKYVNRNWVQSLTYVHWTDERLAWDLVMDCTGGYSKDEISCSAYLKQSDITINEHFGPFGFVLEGHVSLLGQDMNEMYTGSREDLYNLDHAEQMERSSGMAKGVQIATADTYILDKQDFRGIQNEALLDNWKPVALIYPKNLVRTALMIIQSYKDDCGIALKGIPL